jgi:hypothetical protein
MAVKGMIVKRGDLEIAFLLRRGYGGRAAVRRERVVSAGQAGTIPVGTIPPWSSVIPAEWRPRALS